MSPWPRNRALRALAFVWSLPVGIVGCLGALLFWMLGMGRPHVVEGAIETFARGRMADWFDSRGWGAVTVGWWIVYWSPDSAASFEVMRHERRHVRQVLCLGALWVIVYGVLLPCTGYDNHPLERNARAHEGQPGS